jgi:peptidoglycan hydrolase CwlO-like protein
MSTSFPPKHWTRLVSAVVFLTGASSPWQSRATDNTFSTIANQLLAQFQAKSNGLDAAHKLDLEHRINELQATAGTLDNLQNEIDKDRGEVNTLEMDYKNAKANAESLHNQFEGQDARSKIESIVHEEQSICAQLGGNLQGNGAQQMCMFQVTCPADHPEACQTKGQHLKAQFDQQVGPLNSQLKSIVNQYQSEKEQADAAEEKADAKRQEWEGEEAKLADMKNDLTKLKEHFGQQANAVEDALGSAHTAALNPKLGKAWEDLNHVNADRRCYDNGCGMAVEPPRISIPPVVANSPAFTKATEILNAAADKAQSARQALREAERDPATSPKELQQHIQEDSRAQQALLSARYELRLTFPINLTPTPPTAVKPQP